jgi:hypothetical protein
VARDGGLRQGQFVDDLALTVSMSIAFGLVFGMLMG